MKMRKFLFAVILVLLSAGICPAKPADGAELRVMSFNIRMDTADDGGNRWDNRKEFACRMITYHAPDLIGTQEVLHNQLLDMLERLPGYGYVGVGRIDGETKGEYAAIFYRKERFELLDSGNFWLSEDPSAVGVKGWDAACERIATWARFRDRDTGREVFMLNTHFDHVGQVARRESAQLIKRRIAELAGGAPMIVTGDLNAPPGSEVVRAMLSHSGDPALRDARKMAPYVYGPGYTFHNYGRLPVAQRPWIDYIFTSGFSGVSQFIVITDSNAELYTSDHHPVMAVLDI